MKLAFVTYRDAGKFVADIPQEDALLKAYLSKKEVDFTFEVWDDPKVDWEAYDVLVIKSPWDYFEKPHAWYAWLKKIEHKRVLNPVKTLRWNSDKKYLQDVADAGFPIVPTYWLNKGEKINWMDLFAHFSTEKLIIKPRISGGALHTYALGHQDKHKMQEIEILIKDGDYMAQPFVQEIPDKGEWSFLFFNNELSHTLLKTAKEGEFRVQHFFGGSIHSGEAPAALEVQAKAFANRFAADCLYARVDGVEVNGELQLVELELIEPLLFLFTHPQGFDNYYAALQTQVHKKA